MSEKPEALADRLDDERMNLIERLADENERLREKNERLREALEIIEGCRQCVDPLMGNQDVARAALRRERT